MNSCCSNTKNHIQNYNEISCCVEYLLQLNKKQKIIFLQQSLEYFFFEH